MVLRDYIKCATCGTVHLTRAGVGLESYEIQSFDCLSCGIPIVLAVRSQAPYAHFEVVENALIVPKTLNYNNVVNLHPSFAFTIDNYHCERAFPSLEYLNIISNYARKAPGNFQDYASQFDLRNAKNIWGLVKNIVTLQRNGNEKKRDKLITQYKYARKEYVKEVIVESYKDVIVTFFDALFYPKINELIEPILSITEKMKSQYQENYSDFYDFYISNMQAESLNRYESIFTDYFRSKTELSQMLVHARISELDTKDRIVGSHNFDTVKLFYGQAYETLTSQFFVLACLYNIQNGRRFDTFETMTLNKYLKDVEKSKRANPFNNEPAMAVFAKHLDSSIRNGSHHASFWRDGEIIRYRSGGSGAERDIPYSYYLYLCNELAIALAALFSIEILLFDIGNHRLQATAKRRA